MKNMKQKEGCERADKADDLVTLVWSNWECFGKSDSGRGNWNWRSSQNWAVEGGKMEGAGTEGRKQRQTGWKKWENSRLRKSRTKWCTLSCYLYSFKALNKYIDSCAKEETVCVGRLRRCWLKSIPATSSGWISWHTMGSTMRIRKTTSHPVSSILAPYFLVHFFIGLRYTWGSIYGSWSPSKTFVKT